MARRKTSTAWPCHGLGKADLQPPAKGAPKANVFMVKTTDGEVFFAYKFAHPAVAATVAVHDRRRNAYLLVKREKPPFKGRYAFPGGFLDVGRERIEETAARELLEETGVRVAPRDLVLIDVRSDPKRDPRDHVFDIGYYIEVDGAEASAKDETLAIRWASAREINRLRLAFDHNQFWSNIRAHLRSRAR